MKRRQLTVNELNLIKNHLSGLLEETEINIVIRTLVDTIEQLNEENNQPEIYYDNGDQA